MAIERQVRRKAGSEADDVPGDKPVGAPSSSLSDAAIAMTAAAPRMASAGPTLDVLGGGGMSRSTISTQPRVRAASTGEVGPGRGGTCGRPAAIEPVSSSTDGQALASDDRRTFPS